MLKVAVDANYLAKKWRGDFPGTYRIQGNNIIQCLLSGSMVFEANAPGRSDAHHCRPSRHAISGSFGKCEQKRLGSNGHGIGVQNEKPGIEIHDATTTGIVNGQCGGPLANYLWASPCISEKLDMP